MSGRFSGRAVIVTGGASGIGLAAAKRFAREGANVVLLDPDDAALHRAEASIEEDSGSTCRTIIGRSTDPSARAAAIDAAAGMAGGILVNAGASFLAKGVDATDEDWRIVVDNNVIAYARMTADAVELLANGGSVVNVASVSAHIAQPARWTYNAAKGAVTSLTRCQALDLAPMGIRVNSVSPAWIWTPVVERLAGDHAAARRREWGDYHMLRRVGEADEVASAIAFLASDDASFITATDLPVDGGYLAVGGEGVGTVGNNVYTRFRDE